MWRPFFCLLLTSLDWSASAEPRLERFEFSQPQMGVPFRMVLYAENLPQAAAAADAAFKEIERLNQIFSDYEYDSELSALSRTAGSGQAVPISEPLLDILRRSQKLARDSQGAFDVTIGPCVSLWRNSRREKKLPVTNRIERARAAVGYTNLIVNSRARTAMLLKPDMRLDLGGVAKGYAVDAALTALKRQGIERALVAGSGDLAVGKSPPESGGWRIELARPAGGTNFTPEHLLLSHRAVATSGDLIQFVEIDGVRYSHIVDPASCLGLTNQSLVTVIARDCTTADSLATACSVLPPKEALNLIRKYRPAAVRIFERRNGVLAEARSRNFPKVKVHP